MNMNTKSNKIFNAFYDDAYEELEVLVTDKDAVVKDTTKDTINKIDTEGTPAKATHYKGAVEPLEVMSKLLTKDEFIGFLKGNMIKYSYRAGRKQGESGEKDRNKFLVYSEWLRRVNNLEPIVLGDKIITLQKHLQCRDNYHIETFTMQRQLFYKDIYNVYVIMLQCYLQCNCIYI